MPAEDARASGLFGSVTIPAGATYDTDADPTLAQLFEIIIMVAGGTITEIILADGSNWDEVFANGGEHNGQFAAGTLAVGVPIMAPNNNPIKKIVSGTAVIEGYKVGKLKK